MAKRIPLGHGQSASVYAQKGPNKYYAVKCFLKPHDVLFSLYKANCTKEFKNTACLKDCEYIVQVYKFKTHVSVISGLTFSMTMEFCPVSLSQYLRKWPSYSAKLTIFLQIAKAISFIHSHRVAHRDLKIDNICLDFRGNAKLIDFGVSLASSEKEAPSTGVYGTDPFISPEASTRLKYMGYANDLWALGVILFVLVCQKEESLEEGTQHEILLKGKNARNPAISYPWTGPNDHRYTLYCILELVMEESSDKRLEEELVQCLESGTLPSFRTIKDIDPKWYGSLVTLKNKKLLENKEIGIYGLLRRVGDVPKGVWSTLVRLLKLNPGFRGPAEDVLRDPWVLDFDPIDVGETKEFKNSLAESERKLQKKL